MKTLTEHVNHKLLSECSYTFKVSDGNIVGKFEDAVKNMDLQFPRTVDEEAAMEKKFIRVSDDLGNIVNVSAYDLFRKHGSVKAMANFVLKSLKAMGAGVDNGDNITVKLVCPG